MCNGGEEGVAGVVIELAAPLRWSAGTECATVLEVCSLRPSQRCLMVISSSTVRRARMTGPR